ncbi:gliding motility lipoprotein GldH [Dysgonomonas sp. BGC7]|uniref:gliding motility lipoprotein GldH n=1 Tax=Dysgonomonas sp. BGC7 TaxID=1658008 RepID=UPI0006814D90|nr:gliding motility lipoprotein GldH [Dysgonomonas sp. BGC7]MBD8389513.1 gliding motility lipoprotein GldH [Dysgonomonas sp. BGC7]
MENRNKTSRMHKSGYTYLILLLVSLMNISCNKQEVYYHFHEIKDAKWQQKDTLTFDVDSTAITPNTLYSVAIEVSNNVNYPYQNIWFFVQHNFTADSTYTEISREYKLADEFGKWQGSGFGTLYQVSFPLTDIVFREKKNYRIKIEHGMRDEPLNGIEKIGIKISKKQE